MKNELKTLMAAAEMVADTSAVAALSIPTYGSTWLSEVELWVVCSITTAALGCETPAGTTEEHRTFERRELLTRGFHGGMQRSSQHAPVKVPRHGVSRCAKAVFFAADGRSVTFSSKPRSAATQAGAWTGGSSRLYGLKAHP